MSRRDYVRAIGMGVLLGLALVGAVSLLWQVAR